MPHPSDNPLMRKSEIRTVITDALEASIYAASTGGPGLSADELVQILSRIGFGPGEARVAVREARLTEARSGRFVLSGAQLVSVAHLMPFEGDPRDLQVLDVIWEMFQKEHRAAGTCSLSPEAIRFRLAHSAGQPAAIELALSYLEAVGQLEARDGELVASRSYLSGMRPTAQAGQYDGLSRARPWFLPVRQIVDDVVGRRSDGRAGHPEPIQGFTSILGDLGHARFEGWWNLTAAEFQRASRGGSPITCVVLAAALCEGALSFSVSTGISSGRSLASRRLDPAKPSTWKIAALVAAAKTGSDPILDDILADRLFRLNKIRQRIHAGRLLHEHPVGPIPDTRPEQAREADETLNHLLRCLIDWHERGP